MWTIFFFLIDLKNTDGAADPANKAEKGKNAYLRQADGVARKWTLKNTPERTRDSAESKDESGIRTRRETQLINGPQLPVASYYIPKNHTHMAGYILYVPAAL